MKITKAQGYGQGQCALCKKRGRWNVQWMCFLYKVEGKDGVYCKNCVDEMQLQDAVNQKVRKYEYRRQSKIQNSGWLV
jgi:hypothetical protein